MTQKEKDKMTQEIAIGKKYRHYKGNVYQIIALALHSETNEEMIVYKSEKGDVWVRPKYMWNEIIKERGILRFSLLE